MLVIGDKVKFPMWRLPNGCLGPYNEYEEQRKGCKLEMIDGEVIGVEDGIASIKYFCSKCQRFYETSILTGDSNG